MNYNRFDDIELVRMMSNDNESALSEIYSRYWQSLYISAFNVLKDSSACEDIVQDIFFQLWHKRKALEISTSLKAYLHTSVRYNVFRLIKTQKVRTELFEGIEERFFFNSAENKLKEREIYHHVSRIVETLPSKCKEVYKLSREEQLTHKEIASRLNISTKTVENHLTIALKKLRSSMGDCAFISGLIAICHFFLVK